jgi:hypothetical protein
MIWTDAESLHRQRNPKMAEVEAHEIIKVAGQAGHGEEICARSDDLGMIVGVVSGAWE